MLKPRETDILSLFIVCVVLPLVTYFLLGKWNDNAKRKERIDLIAQQVAEESDQIEDMAIMESTVTPIVHLPNNGIHLCANCFSPATTRCSQCKSVRYCSGRCQIAHWRQLHKYECHELRSNYQGTSSKPILIEGSGNVSYGGTGKFFSRSNVREQKVEEASSDSVMSPLSLSAASDIAVITSKNSLVDKKSLVNATVHEGEVITGDSTVLKSSDQAPLPLSQENVDLKEGELLVSEHHPNNAPCAPKNVVDDLPFSSEKANGVDDQNVVTGINANGSEMTINGEILSQKGASHGDKIEESNISSESILMDKNEKERDDLNGNEPHKSPKQGLNVSKDQALVHLSAKDHVADEWKVATSRIVRTMDMKMSTKDDHPEHSEDGPSRQRKMKMIFPYEEFVQCFQMEVSNVSLSPRGLVNCGNSCYANAVLQCLTCTKPFTVYLLRRSHSKAGCRKKWCLMCELEQLVMFMRKRGGPLSPMNILMYIRSLNSQIGDGSQEDAHEFLRLLVASMQTISLEAFGGEKVVDPKLQDTTFMQHMFGGCLTSKVKCLNCNHESMRCENMMDLTLEILDHIKSLEDALTHFTSPEYLEGDNMYRCLRCAAYVRAQKQLKIQDAPNILTIVLKRFQEGNYGKINKHITFPEWLDMVPFMTGTEDVPPRYMLYGVIVHLDTSNASFFGHYISYIKDMQGNWFKVDDTEVKPVKLSQVISQGAYILFYMRSYPRVLTSSKSTRQRPVNLQSSPRIQNSSRAPEQTNFISSNIEKQPYIHTRLDTNIKYDTNICREVLIRESRSRPSILRNYAEFSDPTSSDWSFFTSSDDSSFTTESARDSFSTMEVIEGPFSSVYHSLYPNESTSHRTISCSIFPSSRMLTRFAREEIGIVFSEEVAQSDDAVSLLSGNSEIINHGGHVRTCVELSDVNGFW